MNEKASVMKKEIRAIASYQALMISRWFLSSALLITTLYLGILRFPVTPLYILLFLNTLPAIISYAVIDYSRKSQNILLQNIRKDDSFLLGTIKKKYNYTKLRYTSNSVSYLVAIVFIGLWQYNYSSYYYIPRYLKSLPFFILAVSLMVRLTGILFYQLKLHYDLSHNRV